MGRERIIELRSAEETLAFGKEIALHLQPNAVLALSGELGAGKTTLVQGIARGLGIEDPIQSPTFVYFNRYEGPPPLYHFDLYRLRNASDFLGLGFEEYFEGRGVCAIEWPDRVRSLLPERAIYISISHKPKGRTISICSAFPTNLLDFLCKWD